MRKPSNSGRLNTAVVVEQESLCSEHMRITLALPPLPDAYPGQFVHLSSADDGAAARARPFLRRAFSLAGVRKRGEQCDADVIYRVHGAGTRWLASLRAGDRVSVLGPLGRGFEISPTKPSAWLVAGGVGLPPLLWLAETLHAAGKSAVAFYGARRRELIPLTMRDAKDSSARNGRSPVAAEFARFSIPVIWSTDDGSLGYRGTVSNALAEYGVGWDGDPNAVVVYCCGPEIMMAAVATWCLERSIECQVCVERAMACGTGTCQSCAVRVHDGADAEGWRYALCCTEGPVFEAGQVQWS